MNNMKPNPNTSLFLFTLLIGSFLLFTSYSNRVKNDTISYLSINVNYSSKIQEIIISNKTKIVEKIVVLSTGKRKKKKKFERNGYRVIIKEIPTNIDNSTLLELLEEYSRKGWELNSQSLGLSNDHNELISGVGDYSICIGQYFLSKK